MTARRPIASIAQVTGLQAGLDAARLPAASFVLLGDSITFQNENAAAGGTYSATGYWTHARTRLGAVGYLKNSGVSGDRTDQMLARIQADVIAYAPGWCIIQGGGNDVGQGVSAATIEANLTAIYAALAAAQIRTVICTITPTTSADTAAEKAVLYAVNRWIRAYAALHPGVVLCDWFNVLADAATGNPTTGLTSDGTHPSSLGAARMGEVLYAAIAPHLGPRCTSLLPLSNAEVGSLIPNGMMTGDAGGLATGWTAAGTAWTLTPSKVTRTWPQSGEWQQVVAAVDGSPTSYWSLTYSNTNVGTDWAVGETVYGVCEFEADPGASIGVANFCPIAAVVRAHNINERAVPYKSSSPAEAFTVYPASGVLVTSPLTISAGATSVRLQLRSILAGTVRLGRAAIWKV